MKKFTILLIIGTVLFWGVNVFAAEGLPPGRAITLGYLKDIIEDVVVFIIGLSGAVTAGFAIIAGLKWMSSRGDQTKVEEAKKQLRAALIGAAIIFGTFTILETIDAVIEGSFFDGGSGGPKGTPSSFPASGTKGVGEHCVSDDECASGRCIFPPDGECAR